MSARAIALTVTLAIVGVGAILSACPPASAGKWIWNSGASGAWLRPGSHLPTRRG